MSKVVAVHVSNLWAEGCSDTKYQVSVVNPVEGACPLADGQACVVGTLHEAYHQCPWRGGPVELLHKGVTNGPAQQRCAYC